MEDWRGVDWTSIQPGDAPRMLELLRGAPDPARFAVARQLDACMLRGDAAQAQTLRGLVVDLFAEAGDDEALAVKAGRDSVWHSAALAALDEPAVRWAELLAAMPGPDEVARAELILVRLLLHGMTYEDAFGRLARGGPAGVRSRE